MWRHGARIAKLCNLFHETTPQQSRGQGVNEFNYCILCVTSNVEYAALLHVWLQERSTIADHISNYDFMVDIC